MANRTFRDNFLFDVKAACLEFVGTTTFILLGLGGVQAGSVSDGSTVERTMYYAASLGFSLLVAAWLFYRVTGGLFNPNVTLALCLVGVITPMRFVLFTIAQLVGAIAGAALILALTPAPFNVNVFLASRINKAQGVFIEMFITAALVLAVLMLAAEKHESTPFAPIGIGLTLFVGQLFAIVYTGAAMNTARAFGPAAVTGFPYGGHWVYWVGPYLGSLLGVAIYALLKHSQYWTMNPSQDASNPELSPADPIDTFKGRMGKSGNTGARQSGNLGNRPSAENGREINGGPEKAQSSSNAV